MNPHLKFATLATAAFLAIALPECLLPTFRAAAIAQTNQDSKGKEDRVLQQCRQDLKSQQYEAALRSCNQALTTFQQLKNLGGEAKALRNLSIAYRSLSQYDKAIDYFQQALPLYQQLKDKNGIANTLMSLGGTYRSLSQYDKAIDYFQQALPLYQQLKDRKGETVALTALVLSHRSLFQHEKVAAYLQQALPLYQQLEDKSREARTLLALGIAYRSLSQYDKAIDYFQQALPLYQQLKDKNGIANTLIDLGTAYRSLSQYEKAIDYFQQALPLYQQLKDKNGIANTLTDLGTAYRSLSQYEKAIDYCQQALLLYQQLEDKNGVAGVLGNLGNAYGSLSQYEKSISYFQQALLLYQQLKDKNGEANALSSLGMVYTALSQHEKAISYYQPALLLFQQVKDRNGEANTLSNLGTTYGYLSQYDKAIDYFQQALLLYQQTEYKNGEASTLSSLGTTYGYLSQYDKAIDYLQQALPLYQHVKDREGEGITLSSLGLLFQQQNQPELAVGFYKQSVNVRETIRKDIRNLPRELQASYTESVAYTYRNLADLLLQQNRVIEAMQVLDLLKVQDLQDFLKDVKGNALTAQGVELLPQETAILQAFDGSQQQSLDTLLKNPTIQTQVQGLQRTAAEHNLKLSAYQDLQARINKLGENIALFYPLILEDRLELVVLTKDRPPIHKPVAISRKELETEIQTFRQQLQARSPKIKEPAQQLYQRLIQPIDAELKAAGVETIVYAPDSIMRYVPLAALHDGNQWLAQRYQINYLTALALTPLDKPATPTPRVLAGAVTKEYSPIVNGEKYTFPALSQTQTEVEQIAQRYPNTQMLIDTQLNRGAIETNLSNSNVVHLATHAAFLSGSPDASFILLGDGSTLNLRDLSTFQLPNVSLFVLSACETALGEKLGNGIEIFGFGYQLQRNQVRASLASLWQVSDGGTQVLMNRFYEQLKQGKTVAKAMQQVQQDFLDRKVTAEEMQQVRANYSASSPTKQQDRASARPHVEGGIPTDLSHPYYWAPFILIGNGL